MSGLNNVHEVSIQDIVLDDRLQFRRGSGPHGTNKDDIEKYAELMQEGVTFPPCGAIELTERYEDHEAGAIVLYSGFTRVCATITANKSMVLCEVKPGTWQDARCLAFRQNSSHGRPRNKDELAEVVKAIKGDYPELSIRKIADMAGTTISMVQRILNPEAAAKNYEKVKEQRKAGADVLNGTVSADTPDDESPINDAIEAEAEEETIDPFAEVRKAKRESVAIIADLRAIHKRIEEVKKSPGGSLIKMGVVAKAIEETTNHLAHYTPVAIVPQEVIDGIGKDPTNGQGWIHKLGYGRIPKLLQAKCETI